MAIHISAHFGIIHSTIVISHRFLSLTFLIDALGVLLGPRPDRFFDRASLWVLTIALLSLIGALITSNVAAALTSQTPAVKSLIRRHALGCVYGNGFNGSGMGHASPAPVQCAPRPDRTCWGLGRPWPTYSLVGALGGRRRDPDAFHRGPRRRFSSPVQILKKEHPRTRTPVPVTGRTRRIGVVGIITMKSPCRLRIPPTGAAAHVGRVGLLTGVYLLCVANQLHTGALVP